MTTAYYQNLIRNLRMIIKCGICGHRQKLQFHHIKPTKLNGESRGQNKRFRDIVSHPDCYIPLCYFCHQKVTSGEYTIQRSETTGRLLYGSDGPFNLYVKVI